MRKAELLGIIALCGCAARRMGDVSPDEINWSEATRVPTVSAPAPVEDTTPAVLTRQVLADAAAQGLGHFLSEVDVSPVLEGGRFVGFRLNSARNLRRWRRAGADLRPGDVVTRINDQPIDRPERALGDWDMDAAQGPGLGLAKGAGGAAHGGGDARKARRTRSKRRGH